MALSCIEPDSPFLTEVRFVVAAGMARLPEELRPYSKTDARLTQLVTDPGFDDLLPHERVAALCLASRTAAIDDNHDLSLKLQKRAARIDVGLAAQLNRNRAM